MRRRSDFVEFVTEQMAFVAGLRVRAMFGGYGVYCGNRMFAIIVGDRLYFKANDATCGEFETRGLSPFTYVARGKLVTLQYFEAPPEVFEEPDVMRKWVQMAYTATDTTKKTETPSQR